MAFEGNLKDFSLADMFRLIAAGKKTGTLHLDRGAMCARVCFREGSIYFASSTERHEPLGARLTRARVVTEEQLQHALAVQEAEKDQEGGRRIGRILIDEGQLEDVVLERFVREQIIDTIFDLFRWDTGSLRFDGDEAAPGEDIGLSAPVEAIIEEATRRLEHWDTMGARIPSLDARFVMAVAPAEKSAEIYLAPREWLFLCHMHGGNDIRSMAEVTGCTYFETARILYRMLSAGLVEVLEDAEQAAHTDADAPGIAAAIEGLAEDLAVEVGRGAA